MKRMMVGAAVAAIMAGGVAADDSPPRSIFAEDLTYATRDSCLEELNTAITMRQRAVFVEKQMRSRLDKIGVEGLDAVLAAQEDIVAGYDRLVSATIALCEGGYVDTAS